MTTDPRSFGRPGMPAPSASRPQSPGKRRWPALVTLWAFVALMWVIEAVDQVLISVTGSQPVLDAYGVQPLRSEGLLGILFQPLLHGGWGHLIGNSIGLLVLGSIIALSGLRPLVTVTFVAWLVSGVVSWLLGGAGTVHIGASGVLFGYIFYVIVRGFFSRRILHIVVGLAIGFFYGFEALAGLSPMLDGVSWQGHLGGAVGGVMAAYGLKRGRGPERLPAGRIR